MSTIIPKGLSIPAICKLFPDEASGLRYLESIRWANGVVCPRCGNDDQAAFWTVAANDKAGTRPGLRKCQQCRKQFRVTIGTIFEDSHLPLNLWIIAWYLISGAKKGMSALQLKRHLGIGSYKSAWYMAHRIRHAMRDQSFEVKLSGTVEMDETYVGGKVPPDGKKKLGRPGPGSHKTPVVTIVERGGDKRSMVMESVTSANLKAAVMEHVEAGANVVSDGFPAYRKIEGTHRHYSVNHSGGEYARRESTFTAHTNTVESSFALFKRGIYGSFHHISRKYTPLYLAEFDFRWNSRKTSDGERMVLGLAKTEGKRLIIPRKSKVEKQPKHGA